MKNRPKWLQGLILIFIGYFLFFLRLPFYIEVPGQVFSLDEMVDIEQNTTDVPGDFYITTVGVQQLTPVTFIRSFFPYQDLVTEAELFGDAENFESYDRIQKYYMDSSINHAIKAAFDAAGKSYTFEYNGVYVLQVQKESDFYGQLQIGDIITSVDGEIFENSTEFIDYIANKKIEDEIQLSIKRDNQAITLTGKLIKLETGASGIGIGLVDDTRIVTNPAVSIQSANIGGPSAGLMFSLELYTQLIDENIRSDYQIAGTGTIGPDGEVGRIGGVDKKVVAADREGMDYFLVPDDKLPAEYQELNQSFQSNYETALQTATAIDSEMEIVPVETIQDAIHFLEKLPTKKSTSRKDYFLEHPQYHPLPLVARYY